MSPSWSRLSKTEAKPVKVPESSSALLISSGTDLCCIESPFGATESEVSTTNTGRNLLAVSFGSFAASWRGAVRTLAAGWRRSVTDRAGWPGPWEPAKSSARA